MGIINHQVFGRQKFSMQGMEGQNDQEEFIYSFCTSPVKREPPA